MRRYLLAVLIFVGFSYALDYFINPNYIEYHELKKFYSEIYYENNNISPNCLVNYFDYCYFNSQLYIPKSDLIVDNNFNCDLIINNTYSMTLISKYFSDYNTTYLLLGCKFSLSFNPYCSTYNSYNFTFSFNGTALPQRYDTNSVIVGNISYYDGSTYRTCNITYDSIFIPAPLPNLSSSYVPLNGSRSFDSSNNVVYAYVGDYFWVVMNSSNIRDDLHSGKLRDANISLLSSLSNVQLLNSTPYEF